MISKIIILEEMIMRYGVCVKCYKKMIFIGERYEEIPGICMEGVDGGIELYSIETYKCPNCGKIIEKTELISSSPEAIPPTLEQIEYDDAMFVTGMPSYGYCGD
jgi:DNA-directed RNA polymerase subunit RPC12/RpoP